MPFFPSMSSSKFSPFSTTGSGQPAKGLLFIQIASSSALMAWILFPEGQFQHLVPLKDFNLMLHL